MARRFPPAKRQTSELPWIQNTSQSLKKALLKQNQRIKMADIQSFDLKLKVQPESQQLPTHVSGSESSLSESIVGSDGDGRVGGVL